MEIVNGRVKSWGIHTIIDLKECNIDTIKSGDKLIEYANELVDLIDMKPYLDPIIYHFGSEKHIEGYTLVQFIQTSLISGHFVDATGDAYIDIFSCKEYDTDSAIEFTCKFFEAKDYTWHRISRG